jgi:hypothetical protein
LPRGRAPCVEPTGELRPGALDGELAVPCDPQSAIAGSNTHLRLSDAVVEHEEVAMKDRSRAIGPGEPGQSRKAAAVSRSSDVPRGSLTGANCSCTPL